MKVLILGGTKFVGRALVDAALARGHDITLFNRGTTNPDIYPEIEKLRGDRDGNLDALKGRKWDAVIDTCGYVPRIVGMSAELLADSVEHYTFISSISVYGPPMDANIDENGAVQVMEDETVEEITGETYGALKALCEQAAESAMPDRVLSVRAGLIVGPHDPTDRFSYWTVKMARGGDVLVPPSSSVAQFIDVRDLSEWVMDMAEQRQAGIYNATGPNRTLTFTDIYRETQLAGGDKANLVEVSEEFILENEVQGWSDLPVWLPESYAGMHTVKVDKIVESGMKYRPLDQTVNATLKWFKEERGLNDDLRAGLSADRETELIAKWHESQKTEG